MNEVAWLVMWVAIVSVSVGAVMGFLVGLSLVPWCMARDPRYWHGMVDRAVAHWGHGDTR
jgi:hypothetical protein